jgi:hypothetical protein
MNEKDLLYDVFINAIENCYNEKDDAQIIEDAEKLYKKLCNLLEREESK